jgi:hypothetical protein
MKPATQLHEIRRHQVYRLQRPRNRSLLVRLSHGLKVRLHR